MICSRKTLNTTLFVLFIFFCNSSLEAQKFTQLDQQFTEYSVVDINSLDLYNELKISNRSESTSINISDEFQWEMDLIESNIISPDYTVQYKEGKQWKTRRGTSAIPMNGYLSDEPDSRVSLTFADGFIYGFIRERSETYFIEPVAHFVKGLSRSDEHDKFVIYKESDIRPGAPRSCGVEEMNERKNEVPADHNRSTGDCYEVEYAIASDGLMFNAYGSVAAVETHNIGVTNNVQTNYDDEFADEIQFVIVTQYVSTSVASDPWTNSTNAGTLLNSFRSWAPSGFGVTHDIGSLWTDRNFDGPTVGIAYVGVVCTGSRYNCLMDFTSNASTKRVMVAHEIGHNFDASHDAAGSNTIMAPSVTSSTSWSTASINDITAHYLSRTCLATCVGSGAPPVADASFQVISPCVPGIVQFFDGSTNNPTTWSWIFEGGTPATSTQQNPLVTYNIPGTYSVQLTVSNSSGTDDVVLNQAITIGDDPDASFAFNVFGSGVVFTNTSTGNPTDYFWDFGDGNTSQNENPIHMYANDGTYTVTLLALNGCGDDMTSQNITIATAPTADFTAVETEGCEPFTVDFISQASSNTIGWNWTFPGGSPSSSTLENPQVTYSQPGDYDVTLVVTNSTGTDQITKNDFITVNPLPEPGFNFSVDGGVVSFFNSSIDADDYSWNFGDGNSSTEVNPVHTYTQSGTYTVVLTGTNPCGDVTFSQTVNISLVPVAGITTSSATEGCAPLDVQFMDASSNNPDTYMWVFEGGTPGTSTEANPMVTYNVPGAYDVSLTVTNSSGSDQTTLTDYIIINPETTSDFNYSVNGLVVDFMQNSANGLTYNWNFGDGNTSNSPNPQHIYSAENIYTVALETTGNCGTEVHTETVNLYTQPSADFTSADPTICAGSSVQFSNQSSSNATTYLWTFEGGSPATSTAINPAVSYSANGSFDVTLEVSNPAGTDVMTISDFVVVNDVPVPGFNANHDLLQINFTNTTLGGNSFNWNFGDGSTSTDVSPSHTYAAEGDYTVILTATNECGSQTFTQTITVNDAPSADASASTTSGCGPLTVQFNDESSSNVISWSWTFEGGSPATSALQNPTVVYTSPGVYDVTLSVEGEAGTDVIFLEDYIEVYTGPAASFTATATGNMINMVATATADTYTWVVDGQTLTGAAVSYTPSTNGEYIVELVVENECGTDVETQTVTIDVYPEYVLTNNSIEVCENSTFQFADVTVESDIDAYEVILEGPETLMSTDTDPDIMAEVAGQYDLTLTVSNIYGSTVYTVENYLTVISLPVAEFDLSLNAAMVTFVNSSIGNDFLWDFGDGNTSTEISPVHTYETSGDYTISLTVSNDCGTVTTSSEVTLNITTPQIDVETSQNVGCGPLEVQFTDQSAGEPTAWEWSFPGGNPSMSTDQNPVVTYEEEGVYNVTVKVSNEFGTSNLLINDAIMVFNDPMADYIYVQNAGFVDFQYEGSMVESYLWDFGDGNTSMEENPTHQFLESGSYDVMLTVINPCGVNTYTETIDVIISSTNQQDWVSEFTVYPNPNYGQFSIDLLLNQSMDIRIEIMDILGRRMYEERVALVDQLNGYRVDLGKIKTGTYLVRMSSENKMIYRKIIVL